MSAGPHRSGSEDAGWRWRNVPIPEAHVGALAVGIVAQLVAPWALVPSPWIGHLIGWPLVLGGALLAAMAVRAAGAVDLEEPGRLVVRGPYARSRNPMYVAWTLVYLGVAFAVNTGWPLVLLPAVLLLTHLAVRREERRLAARFGAEFDRYRATVRRYL